MLHSFILILAAVGRFLHFSTFGLAVNLIVIKLLQISQHTLSVALNYLAKLECAIYIVFSNHWHGRVQVGLNGPDSR